MPAIESSKSAAMPPRFWWLKRGALAFATLLVALSALRLWWGHIAQQRMDAAMNAAAALGGPVTVEDWNNRPSLGDADNAALLLGQAAAAIHYTTAQRNFDDNFTSIAAMTASDGAILHGLVQGNVASIALVRTAASMPRADWPITFSRPVMAVLLPYLAPQRRTANLTHNAAIDEHLHGDDAAAMMDMDAIVAHGDLLEQGPPMIINHLVACGIDGVGCSLATDLAGELSIDSPAAKQRAAALISRLLDDRALVDGGVRGWRGERMFALDVDQELAIYLKLNAWGTRAMWIVRPGLELEAVRMFQQETAASQAMRQMNYQAAMAAISPPSVQLEVRPSHLLRMFVDIMRPSFARLVSVHFRTLANRRAAALLLALREYELDHQGALPANLEALVPRYLLQVPQDPFSPTGARLKYLPALKQPNGPPSAAIYSVGEDGVDNGGSMQGVYPSPFSSPSRWECKDAVFLLHPAPAPPTSQP